MAKMKVLWSGRFKKGIDPRLKEYSYSMLVDSELLDAEICVNQAYAKMLAKVGLVTSKDATKLSKGLRSIAKSWKSGDACRYFDQYEDIHTFIQAQLEKKVGDVGKKIHTGRSRNDLVTTSTRYYLRFQVNQILDKLIEVQKALVVCAKKVGSAIIPGFTHLKKAQPILAAHHFLAYVEMLDLDRQRLTDARERMNVLPLGSAALAGSSLPLDQKYLANQLGFAKVSSNSMAAVSDRDYLAEILSGLSILWMHLSRLSEDMILWNSEAFNFIELDDSFSTGSSLMPQKKNPDVFELTRGKSAGVFGDLISILTVQKGLPLAYNRDLQDDKPPVFRSVRTTLSALEVLTPTLKSISFNKKEMEGSLDDDGLYATDLLEYLVRKKMPFSEAHHVVGQIVRFSTDKEVAMRDMKMTEWKKFSKHFGDDIYDLFNPKTSVEAKKTIGSTNPFRVKAEIQRWEKLLKKGR